MCKRLRYIVFWAWVCVTFAQTTSDSDNFWKQKHSREDYSWSLKTGVPASDVREMRIAAGISDVTPNSVANIEVEPLKQRKQVLLVQSNGGCIRLHVLERTSDHFAELWTNSEIPRQNPSIFDERKAPGQWICGHAPRGPSAHATEDGQIIVEVPVLLDISQRSLPVYTYKYAWNGRTYSLLDERPW
ncbi:hypothetical protein SBA3_1330008 [Candidatus Sulfopaludibacter sp. SbA3]|nr:hypothetical protein SBA3_1330008 [Candidatus Sulfopaludibacter sp. SbA3]